MRLYVNPNEIKSLKYALRCLIEDTADNFIKERCTDLLERVELCEALQKNTAQAKRGDRQ